VILFAANYNSGHRFYGQVLLCEYPPTGLLGLRPVQVFVEEVEGGHAVDGVAAVEELDGGLVACFQRICLKGAQAVSQLPAEATLTLSQKNSVRVPSD